MTGYLKWIAKGLTAATAAVGVIVVAVTAGSPGGADITTDEWWQVVLVVLGAIGVITIPNGPKPGGTT